VPIILKTVSLKLLESSGPLQTSTGFAIPLHLPFYLNLYSTKSCLSAVTFNLVFCFHLITIGNQAGNACVTWNWGVFVPPLTQWKSNKNYIFWECVCSLRYPACNAHALFYIVNCGYSDFKMFFHIISQTTRFSGYKMLLYVKCVLIFSTNFFWHISWHIFWHIFRQIYCHNFWHIYWHFSGIFSDIFSDTLSDTLKSPITKIHENLSSCSM